PVKDARLLVSVTKEGRVLLGETDITGRVPQALRESARVQNEGEIYIRADKDARYGVVAEVVAASRSNGVQSLNLLVQPELEPVAETDSAPAASNTPPSTASPQASGGPAK
ncbi:MAG TPA: biopolymer transporter ExbD, partial [Polyangiaceae bacterium]|nr:biopolymer transporter ExbD [Polyangiaceae bacterium]